MVLKAMNTLNSVIGQYVGVETHFDIHSTKRLLERFNGRLTKPIVQAIKLGIKNAELDGHFLPGQRFDGYANVQGRRVKAVVELSDDETYWKIVTLILI